MTIASPSQLNPKLKQRYRNNATKGRDKREWIEWKTYETARVNATPMQRKCWESFEDFRKLIAKHKTFNHHKSWESLLNTGEDSRYLRGVAGRDTLILAPRGSSKSTYLAEWIAWQVGLHAAPWHKISLKILYISYELTTAAQKSRQIQELLSVKEYQQIFPWIRPSKKKWGEREWAIDFEWAQLPTTEEPYTLCCAGLAGACTGKRAHLLALDDLIKSPDDIANPTVRDRMVNNWNTVIRFVRFDGSRAICLGTRMRADDIYCTTFVEPKWLLEEQSALLTHDDGTEFSYWEPEGPEEPGQPLSMLQQEREEDPVTFSYQRQNKIVRVEIQSINPGQILRGILPSQFQSLVLGVDLSAGLKESNDYTAMVLGGVFESLTGNQYWVIDSWEDRIMGNTPKLDAIIDLWETWKHLLPQTQRFNPKTGEWEQMPVLGLELWFDSSAYGLSLQGDYEDHIIKRNQIHDWHVRPVPASGRGGKLERLRRHTGLFHNKLVYFNMYGRCMPDGRKPMGRLIQQVTEFGSTAHDDLADAFELCLSGLRSHLPMTRGSY
ncbi:hypothetical protein G7B40_001675 [Aetokthonos hydrillicola Thurmond2011]|jgi:hypothetical protein|uniref:Terminase large subunit gp17-like C-terminal domain-containing protein n=1 Tax=Aetokthonos hydrillicola Thurmond2011 TaxID=2712845 RepID=A0AAP5I247_9CYAN|nr:hypothetical protein [Aetokthonos hydrillicola]MBO3462968.1 hypothetical protein [Aetokthonos hydrillicola CCALA 1050]MBW4591264.1 hypothetical protein [Aetokthonos hydrillicola CCALA 1050]MDR9893296.1 hypothetical protein [Aetokthonos hydrillicola Thurmond2011]